MNEIIEIRIDQLKPGDNPRKMDFKKDEDMENLQSTMEKVGFEGIDPILVYPTDNLGAYEIDDGHRRFHCAAKMEWKRLRAIIVPRPRTEADRFFKRGLRNLNQKKLTNGELTRFVGRLYHEFKWTQDKIAEQTNLSQGYVSELSCIYNYPILLEYIDNNGQMMIAKELAKINDVVPMQSLIEQGCTVDSVKEYRAVLNNKKKEEDAEKPKETPLEEEREASTEEELTKLEGQTPGTVLENLIPDPPGDDGGTVPQPTPEISPDGEPEQDEGQLQTKDNAIPPSPTESSPSKLFEKRTTCLNCFKPLKFGAKAIDKKSHDCKNLFQQIEIMNLQFPNMAVKEGKNGYRLRQNGIGIDELQKGLKVIENHQNWVDNVQNATKNEIKFENAKSKIGGS